MILAAAPINSLQQFKVMAPEAAGQAEIAVAITSPSGNRIKAHIIPVHGGYVVDFTPNELGDYLLNISFGGAPISHLPYRLRCLAATNANKVRAFGPGLEGGSVGCQAQFVIDTRGAGQGGLGVTVEGPSEAALHCRDNGDGTCSVAYLPTVAGEYFINITFNDEPVCGSPFVAVITNDVDVSHITISGNGIQRNGRAACARKPAQMSRVVYSASHRGILLLLLAPTLIFYVLLLRPHLSLSLCHIYLV